VSPVPRPRQRFWRCCDRWMTISRHPGPVCRDHPAFRAGDHDLRRSFRPPTTPAVSTADTLTELGFCSLAPAAFFEARLTSVFETRCRLPTSATTYTTCGQPNPGSLDPCWDGGLDLLPVLPGHVIPPARAVTRGKPRYVQWTTAPVLVRPGDPGLPNRDAFSAASPPWLAPRCIVRIDVLGSKD